MTQQTPDFDSIKQISPYGVEFWSARRLMPLLGYGNKWQNFETAIKKAMIAFESNKQVVADHFTSVSKKVPLGSGAEREIRDYLLSQFACYLIAQNGDPRKPEIAAAQAYFAISTRQYEIFQLRADQEERLRLRERVSEDNKALNSAAMASGVLPESFGIFHAAGYQGLYGMDLGSLKLYKGIPPEGEALDYMGRAELAANDFRITQTEERLRLAGNIGQSASIEVHLDVGKEVRTAIKKIGNPMPEDLPAEPSIRPLLDERKRKRKKAQKKITEGQPDLFGESQ
jgi:DNA-damage-inducible protein D